MKIKKSIKKLTDFKKKEHLKKIEIKWSINPESRYFFEITITS